MAMDWLKLFSAKRAQESKAAKSIPAASKNVNKSLKKVPAARRYKSGQN